MSGRHTQVVHLNNTASASDDVSSGFPCFNHAKSVFTSPLLFFFNIFTYPVICIMVQVGSYYIRCFIDIASSVTRCHLGSSTPYNPRHAYPTDHFRILNKFVGQGVIEFSSCNTKVSVNSGRQCFPLGRPW